MTVGYGNHEQPGSGQVPKTGERADPKTASAKPGTQSTDRPGMDLGGAGDLSAAQGAGAGSRSQPDPSGQGPHSGQRDSASPVLTDANTDEARAPGSGAFPTNPQGNETDPGAG